MRRILPWLIGASLVLYGWQKYHANMAARIAMAEGVAAPAPVEDEESPKYQCDGRIYCSQMSSCEEATWVLQHCPGTKMDGEGDGIPCERQWCGRH